MKVRYASAGEKTINGEHLIERKRDLTPGRQSFEQQFNSSAQEQYEQNMAELAEKINRQGSQLAEKINIAEMEQYRALVTQLLNEVISHAYAFQKENTFDHRGRRKVHAVIVIINEKLEEMAKDILGGNQDAIRIISNIDDIRGLITDILL